MPKLRLRLGGFGLRQSALRFVILPLSHADRRICLIDLLDGNVLLFEEGLDPMQVVCCELQLRIRRGGCRFGPSDGGLRTSTLLDAV